MDSQDEVPFHIVTPLKESSSLSKWAGTRVLMKLENIQPMGSFKIRGIGHFCQKLAKQGCKKFVCSSGGNAGLAAAYACNKLGLPATIVVPEQTSQNIIQGLEGLGVEVVVTGKVWDDANAHAHRLADAPGSVYISPFNHPLLWEGHSSLVLELKAALGNQKPGALVVSVGGGGLLAGIVEGLTRVGWSDVPIIAMETMGAHCLNAALEAGKPVTLPDITSIAKCLGAKTVCDRALECARKYKVISVAVDDVEAVRAIEMFVDDERMLVEAACGAALAAVYSGHIQQLQQEGKLEQLQGPLIMIVCGGSSISLSELKNFKSQLGMV
ncbi:PREDICTED: serine dehydratase-like [Nanorana parkeri]|uniref:serine dehydratase-like n=1 Tax=Nanorana parkeri TaxID=125878 RepID=UPI00085445C2|nr:PREDICTED: serine dehydratase-like [Nanorana parkeri]XP_018416087.1 PREDICTED: serine dehydratase-like [Nanorana parkeri]